MLQLLITRSTSKLLLTQEVANNYEITCCMCGGMQRSDKSVGAKAKWRRRSLAPVTSSGLKDLQGTFLVTAGQSFTY